LKWNSSGTQLASGGNDNRLIIWDRESTKPQFQFRTHQAAVKAIDWNPHQAGVLASGGGTADRHIRFWNTMTGTSIGAHDTGSQVGLSLSHMEPVNLPAVKLFLLIS
jgi:cell division cycle 20-like protein 1 (cofactor of APC complex)